MNPKCTLEEYLDLCLARAALTLTYLDLHSPGTHHVAYVEGWFAAIRLLITILPDFRDTEANAYSQYAQVYDNPLA